MATVIPFCGIRYNPHKINGSLDTVVAPPYDVIDFDQQEALYRASPHNAVRLILGRQYDGDSPSDNRYTRSATTLDKWLREGVLSEDMKPAFYVYEQSYTIKSGHPAVEKTLVRRGVLVALKLETLGQGTVYPHEETFPSHKADRLNLMRACRANFSPVFGLVPDPEKDLHKLLQEAPRGAKPEWEIKEDHGISDRLWPVDDPAICQKLMESFAGRKVFIADGHHRYETACNYRDERRRNDSTPYLKAEKFYDFVLMMCVPMSDPGLFILPTHRLIHKQGLKAAELAAKTGAHFDLAEASDTDLYAVSERSDGPVRFGLVFPDGAKRLLTAKPAAAAEMKALAAGKSDHWRELDVAILHELLLKKLLDVPEQHTKTGGPIAYTKAVEDVLKRVVPGGDFGFGVVMRPTRIEQVCAVSETGERMPHKSTYFYPKLLSGLVMRRL
ncbi:MAG: DUF1015 domain-containing protein [Planctomycetes bacterium]|nr:DUF1015 domain-containing protein [Planctomycetota bacterium]